MKSTGIVEIAISVADVKVSARFYQDLFGFECMIDDERLAALNAGPGHVFLIFKRGGSMEGVQLPGGFVPGHDGRGESHFALGIPAEEFDAWGDELKRRGIAIESTVQWERGGRSIYFRDPDNHCVELVTPGVWVNY